jgi:hypothetical protein
MHSVSVAELRGTFNYIKILSVARQCFYMKFMSPATMPIVPVFVRNYIPFYLHSSHVIHKRCIERKECLFPQWPSLDVKYG